jgi:hypothetical protein
MIKSIVLFFFFFPFSINSPDTTQTIDSITIKPDSVSGSMDSLLADTMIVDDSSSITVKSKPELVYPIVENNAFFVGEKLTFKVRYGFVRAGTATMSILKETELNGHPVYQIQTTAVSVSPFSWVYKVDDVVNSFIDKNGLFSWRFEKKIREGSYKMDLLVDYLPEDSLAKIHTIRYKDEIEEKRYDVKVPPFAMDVLASFYYIRTKPLRIGDIISIVNHDNKKVYDLEIHVYMREEIDTAAGTFRCLRVEPLLKGEGIFKQKGRLLVWLTDDQYKIPVQMTSEVAVGHITTELEKIEGIKHKLPSLISK